MYWSWPVLRTDRRVLSIYLRGPHDRVDAIVFQCEADLLRLGYVPVCVIVEVLKDVVRFEALGETAYMRERIGDPNDLVGKDVIIFTPLEGREDASCAGRVTEIRHEYGRTGAAFDWGMMIYLTDESTWEPYDDAEERGSGDHTGI